LTDSTGKKNGALRAAELLGERIHAMVLDLGAIFTLFLQVVSSAVRPPSEIRNIVKQMEEVGVRSMPVVLVTATFTGMVLALQSYSGFQRFGATSFVGSVVALSITRELGPVFAGLMVSGRVGASMAAELGTMKVTEQIDALVTLATNPVKYLVVPRVVAATIVLPVLVVFADLLGIPQPEVSHLMNGHFSRFTTDKLLDFLKRLDRKVTIRISSHKPGEPYQVIGFAS